MLALGSLFLLAGCSIQDHLVFKGSGGLRSTNPDKVRLYTGGEVPGKKIRYVGYVVTDMVGNDAVKAVNALKDEAAMLGANAVIHVRLTKLNGFCVRCGAAGIAVLAE
jgi:hypothetical protein